MIFTTLDLENRNIICVKFENIFQDFAAILPVPCDAFPEGDWTLTQYIDNRNNINPADYKPSSFSAN